MFNKLKSIFTKRCEIVLHMKSGKSYAFKCTDFCTTTEGNKLTKITAENTIDAPLYCNIEEIEYISSSK